MTKVFHFGSIQLVVNPKRNKSQAERRLHIWLKIMASQIREMHMGFYQLHKVTCLSLPQLHLLQVVFPLFSLILQIQCILTDSAPSANLSLDKQTMLEMFLLLLMMVMPPLMMLYLGWFLLFSCPICFHIALTHWTNP